MSVKRTILITFVCDQTAKGPLACAHACACVGVSMCAEGTRAIRKCNMTHVVLYDTTHLYVRRDALACANDAFVCTISLICVCVRTHLYVQHDSFVCASKLVQVRCRCLPSSKLAILSSYVHCLCVYVYIFMYACIYIYVYIYVYMHI